MSDLPKYVVIQVSKNSFIVGRLPIGGGIYQRLASTETEAAAQQLSSVLTGAKRSALRTQKDPAKRKQPRPFTQPKQPMPRKERQVRVIKPRPDPVLSAADEEEAR